MTLHAVKNSPLVTNYDFIANPVLFTSNATGTVSIVATSYGAALNVSGNRLWNQSALPLSSVNTLLSGQSLTLPFIATNLPNYYFDAIILLTVDGLTRLPYAFSNSPDNIDPTTTVANKILYWPSLHCFGLNNTVGNNNTANNYMFGGRVGQAAGGLSINGFPGAVLNFSEPLPAPLMYSFTINYVSYTLGLHPYTFTGTSTAPANALSDRFLTTTNPDGLFAANGFRPVDSAGYFLISFTVADTNYRSLLKKYHWGLA
jgi:hypothetical protein